MIHTGGEIMNQLVNEEKIEDLIYEIRGKQAMIDSEKSISKYHNYTT